MRQLSIILIGIIIFVGVITSCQSKKIHPLSLFSFQDSNELYGYKDQNGKVVIPSQFILANDFLPSGIAAVVAKEGWVYINSFGKIILTPYMMDNGPDYFSEGLARYVENGKIGYFDPNGRTIIPARFDFATPFNKGVAKVCHGGEVETIKGDPDKATDYHKHVGGKWGLIDKEGKIIQPIEYKKDDLKWPEN